MKNIVLVVFDCLRADFCFPTAPPSIEQLKNHGESYTQFISVATCTVPCFASMLTGLYPETHGIKGHPDQRSMITDNEWSLKKNVVTLPQILKKHGYHTYAELSDPLVKPFGLDKGFDHYNQRNQKTNTFQPEYFDYLKNLIDSFKQPYFFLLHLFELHKGLSYERFKKQCETLERLFVDRDAIIVITGDHGETTGKGSRHGKSIQEHLVRIPLIIADGARKTVNDQYSQVDLLPIILFKLGIKADLPYRIPGNISPRQYAYMRAVGAPLLRHEWMVGIRTEQYKFVTHPLNKAARDELYIIPDESPLPLTEYIPVVDELRNKLQEIMGEAENLRLGKSPEWSEGDEKIIVDRLKKLGYID